MANTLLSHEYNMAPDIMPLSVILRKLDYLNEMMIYSYHFTYVEKHDSADPRVCVRINSIPQKRDVRGLLEMSRS